MDDRKLQRAQAYATIAASVAVPILVALFGWLIQAQTSSEGVRKDYVQMAVTILSSENAKPELRSWATKVLEKSSPVPFSDSLKSGLSEGTVVIGAALSRNILGTGMMEPAEPLKELPTKNGSFSCDELALNYAENVGIASRNTLKLKYLQELVRELVEVDNRQSSKDAPASTP